MDVVGMYLCMYIIAMSRVIWMFTLYPIVYKQHKQSEMDMLNHYRVDNIQSLNPNLMNIVDLYFTLYASWCLYGIYVVLFMWVVCGQMRSTKGVVPTCEKKNFEGDLLCHTETYEL